MGVLSNKIDRDQLKPGDHIYSWRHAYIYAHHGTLFIFFFGFPIDYRVFGFDKSSPISYFRFGYFTILGFSSFGISLAENALLL